MYRVRRLTAAGPGWAGAARAVVRSACDRYDDARVGHVAGLRCRVTPDGQLTFETELAVSTRFTTDAP